MRTSDLSNMPATALRAQMGKEEGLADQRAQDRQVPIAGDQ
jgi:hypothetical protein